MNLEELIKIKRFESRRNEVYLIKDKMNNEYVMKIFKNSDDMENELKMLIISDNKNLDVPRVIYSYEDTIIMEYIKGSTLLQIYEKYEKRNLKAEEIIEKLYIWLANFYDLFRSNRQVIIGDVNFKNFILSDKFYGIDFEKCGYGKIEQDVGRLCAFALTYTPEFTDWKIKFSRTLYDCFMINMMLDSDKIKLAMIEKFSQRGIESEKYNKIITSW